MPDLRGNDEPLPWLQEAIAPERGRGNGGFGRMAVTLACIFVVAAIISVFAWWFLFREGAVFGTSRLIHAPGQPYRVKPLTPGGMKVEGTGDVAYGASEGQDVDSLIDLNAMPETPIVVTVPPVTPASDPFLLPGAAGAPGPSRAAAVPAPAPAPQGAVTPPAPKGGVAPPTTVPAPVAKPAVPAAKPTIAPVPTAKPAVPVPAPRPVAPVAAVKPGKPPVGGTIQLGAFSSQAKAAAAWKTLSARFGFLQPLTNSIVVVKTDETTFYRLRAAAGSEAATVCKRMRVAGETCTVIG